MARDFSSHGKKPQAFSVVARQPPLRSSDHELSNRKKIHPVPIRDLTTVSTTFTAGRRQLGERTEARNSPRGTARGECVGEARRAKRRVGGERVWGSGDGDGSAWLGGMGFGVVVDWWWWRRGPRRVEQSRAGPGRGGAGGSPAGGQWRRRRRAGGGEMWARDGGDDASSSALRGRSSTRRSTEQDDESESRRRDKCVRSWLLLKFRCMHARRAS
jgi:hypothetical protein